MGLSACVSCSLSLPVSEAQPDSDPFYRGGRYGRHYGHGYGGYGYKHHGYGQQRKQKSVDLKRSRHHYRKYGFKLLEPTESHKMAAPLRVKPSPPLPVIRPVQQRVPSKGPVQQRVPSKRPVQQRVPSKRPVPVRIPVPEKAPVFAPAPLSFPLFSEDIDAIPLAPSIRNQENQPDEIAVSRPVQSERDNINRPIQPVVVSQPVQRQPVVVSQPVQPEPVVVSQPVQPELSQFSPVPAVPDQPAIPDQSVGISNNFPNRLEPVPAVPG